MMSVGNVRVEMTPNNKARVSVIGETERANVIVQMKESSIRFFLSHINLLKLVNLLTSTLLFHSLHIVLLGLFLLSHLVVLLSPLVLK